MQRTKSSQAVAAPPKSAEALIDVLKKLLSPLEGLEER